MKLHNTQFALAVAAVVGVAYSTFSLFLKFAPEAAAKSYGALLHLSQGAIIRNLSFTTEGFLLGLVHVLITAFAAAWVFGYLLNRYSYRD